MWSDPYFICGAPTGSAVSMEIDGEWLAVPECVTCGRDADHARLRALVTEYGPPAPLNGPDENTPPIVW